MTPAGAEILLLGLLAGFFVSRVLQQFTSDRTRALDDETYAKLEEAVEAALARRLASGNFVSTPPATATATAASAAVSTDTEAEEAESSVATAEAPVETEDDAPGLPEGQLIPMIVTTIDGEKHELEIKSGENMLDAALDREVDIDYSCKDGGCDTCTVRVLSGMENLSDVRDEERDMLDDDEIAAGNRLSCIVTVRGPVELVQEER